MSPFYRAKEFKVLEWSEAKAWQAAQLSEFMKRGLAIRDAGVTWEHKFDERVDVIRVHVRALPEEIGD